MEDITAIILTKNEEKNIKECLSSIKGFAKRALVIDCGSTDSTREIAESLGADVLIHPFEYYAKQFNWGIKNGDIKTTWILRLDADERFSPQLNDEISQILAKNADDITGITIEADYYFLNRRIKHGLRKKRKMMLFKYRIGEIEDRRRDAHSIIHSGRSVSVKNRFLHYDFKNLTAYIDRYNWYATKEMEDFLFATTSGLSEIQNSDDLIKRQRKKKYAMYYKAPMFLRAYLWFIYNYIFRLGFLDGKEGFLFHYFECYWYRMLVDAKILDYEKISR